MGDMRVSAFVLGLGFGSRMTLLVLSLVLLIVHAGNAADPSSLAERNELTVASENVHRPPLAKRPFCNIYGGCSAAYQLGSRKRWLFAPTGADDSAPSSEMVRRTMPSDKELDEALTVVAAAEGNFLKNAYRTHPRDLVRP